MTLGADVIVKLVLIAKHMAEHCNVVKHVHVVVGEGRARVVSKYCNYSKPH